MLDRLRGRLGKSLEVLGTVAARVGVSPAVWTAVGLAVALLAGLAYSYSGYSWGLAGGVLILVAGFFDVVDGAVARVTNSVSKRGAFLDSTLDRVAEVAIYLGLLVGGYSSPVIIVLTLSASLLVSYTRAKGDALGVALSGVGVGERSERLLVLAVASLIGLEYWGIVLVGVLAWFTFLERTWRASSALGPKSG